MIKVYGISNCEETSKIRKMMGDLRLSHFYFPRGEGAPAYIDTDQDILDKYGAKRFPFVVDMIFSTEDVLLGEDEDTLDEGEDALDEIKVIPPMSHSTCDEVYVGGYKEIKEYLINKMED